MPEGHTIHRAARLQRSQFGGEVLAVDSPQGRFDAGAAVLDGQSLVDVEAHGKHLFHRWSAGDTLHVHLGLVGVFRTWAEDPPEATDGTRLRWQGPSGTLHLAGPMACELVDPDTEAAIRDALGPDPLAPTDGAAAEFVEGLARRRMPLGHALLDQALLAGIGNVYRAELCFLAGIDPRRPAREVGDDDARGLWDLTVNALEQGERTGRIVTVDPAEVDRKRPRDVPDDERLYVYKRQGEPCRRCGTPIDRAVLGGRKTWWCPTCQPE